MKKAVVAGFLALAVLLIAVVPTQAQLGVGIKIPPLIPPSLFGAYWLAEDQLIEVSGGLQSVAGFSSISIGVNYKQYLSALDAGNVVLTPFLGGGAGITLASSNVLGQASSFMSIGVAALAGVELPFPSMPISMFAEFSPVVVITPVFGFAIGGSIGARFDF